MTTVTRPVDLRRGLWSYKALLLSTPFPPLKTSRDSRHLELLRGGGIRFLWLFTAEKLWYGPPACGTHRKILTKPCVKPSAPPICIQRWPNRILQSCMNSSFGRFTQCGLYRFGHLCICQPRSSATRFFFGRQLRNTTRDDDYKQSKADLTH